MAIDIETKREIIELYFSQRKTIREVAKIVKKSSRDVVAVVKEYKQKLWVLQTSIHSEDNVNQPKGKNA
jgi:DNA-directed RNA polymerase specialized sigma subunit